MCVCVRSLQLRLTLCDPMDCNWPGSCVHEILQARILEGVAMPSSGIFLIQGLNLRLLCLLHWQVGSLPPVLSGKPELTYTQNYIMTWYIAQVSLLSTL